MMALFLYKKTRKITEWDNAGVTKNVSVMHKEYANAIGTTVDKLTHAQNVEAE